MSLTKMQKFWQETTAKFSSRFFDRIDLSRPFYVGEENLEKITSQLRRQTRSCWSSDPQTSILRDKDCPDCGSYLICQKVHKRLELEDQRIVFAQALEVTCPNCQRQTVEDPFVPENDNPSMIVKAFSPEWVKCPNCNGIFKYTVTACYKNGRHQKCGQKLSIGEF